jgi:hypothetical protein
MGLGSTIYQHTLYIHPNHIHLLDGLITPLHLKFIPAFTLILLIMAYPMMGKTTPGSTNSIIMNYTGI